MSRVIVKNLHKTTSEKELLQVFSTHGQVTDIQLKYTKTGIFRGFAFVGFRGGNEADAVIQEYNDTFIGATKINVQHCTPLGSSDKPRGWSKYAADSSAYSNCNQSSADSSDLSKQASSHKTFSDEDVLLSSKISDAHNDDPKFQEFLSVHGVQGSQAAWADGPIEKQPTIKSETHQSLKEPSPMSDMEFLKSKMAKGENAQSAHDSKKASKTGKKAVIRKFQLDYTVKISNMPQHAKKKYVKTFLAPLKPKSLRMPPKIRGIAFIGFLTEKEMNQALNKHRTYHEGRCLDVRQYVERKPGTHGPKNDVSVHPQTDTDPVGETGRIFVRNLPQCTTEEDLEKLFTEYGQLVEVNMPIDRYSRKVKGFAFVGFMFPENAEKAFAELDGSIFLGRMLHLIPAKPKTSVDQDGDELSSNFKEKKEQQKKKEASSSHNWNTLFLGANSVADIMAVKYDTTKKDVLSSEGTGSAAVRLALGETQLVAETREFLEENGIQLDAFSQPTVKRSNTVILAKNLPANTDQQLLREKFSKYGQLGRLVLPPSGVTAVIEFLESSEARVAFKSLAYTRLVNSPLYLEWAPVDLLAEQRPEATAAPSSTSAGDPEVSHKESERIPHPHAEPNVEDAAKNSPSEDPVEPAHEEGATLFVKNVSFSTTDDALKEHFSGCGRMISASVSRRKNPKRPDELLSQGYGFVTYLRRADAKEAMKKLQLSSLDGHCLELKVSNRTVQSEVTTHRQMQTMSKQKSSKLIVKNIPFQANQKEVTELFKTFGELDAVRMPKKMTDTESGHHRGFAFVEFNTRSDAKRAFKALCASTHLYGRRLVLDWAEADDDVELLRTKTAVRFSDGAPSKKRVKMDDD